MSEDRIIGIFLIGMILYGCFWIRKLSLLIINLNITKKCSDTINKLLKEIDK